MTTPITDANLNLKINRNLDGSFRWYTSGCKELSDYHPHACLRATAMSIKGEQFNLLVTVPPEAIDEGIDLVEFVRRAALVNANFPSMIAGSWDEGIAKALLDESKSKGLVQ